MVKNLTCIECPVGCALCVDTAGSGGISVTGHACPKGEVYAKSEIENPVRIVTATVMTTCESIKFLPVKTDRPIPKKQIFNALAAIRKIIVEKPLGTGDIVAENFLGLGVNLVATRDMRSPI